MLRSSHERRGWRSIVVAQRVVYLEYSLPCPQVIQGSIWVLIQEVTEGGSLEVCNIVASDHLWNFLRYLAMLARSCLELVQNRVQLSSMSILLGELLMN